MHCTQGSAKIVSIGGTNNLLNKNMTRETLITIQNALVSEKFRAVEYAKKYPDGGWSNDAVNRLDNAIQAIMEALSVTK